MLGLALLALGILLLWAAFTGRGDAIINALNMDLPSAGANPSSGGGGGGGGGGSGGGGSSSSSTDIGTHQAETATGDVYTVNSTYGSATPQQQDDMNRFAHNNTG